MTKEEEVITRAIETLDVADVDRWEAELGRVCPSKDPDIPACDACGKEFSANLICSRCQSAFYCTKECQKSAWKFGGHKQLCDGMKEQCASDAKRVMNVLTRRNTEDCMTLERHLLLVQDGAGAYKAAVAEGLHAALRGLFRDDAENVLDLLLGDGDISSSVLKAIRNV
jgi:hypothetical protein